MMMSKNIFVQIAMIAISIGIILTFVKPTFAEIGTLQDSIVVYQTEQQKVSGVNAQLASLVNVLNNVAPDDQRRLLTYMPDEVDTISVVRDLTLITAEAGVEYVSAVSTDVGASEQRAQEATATFIQPRPYGFNLSVEGTYAQIKNLFVLLEQNNYPLEVKGVTIQQIEGGFLGVVIDLSTYAHDDGVTSEEIVF